MAGILLSKIQNELLDLQIKKVLLYIADVVDGVTDAITGSKAGDFIVKASLPAAAPGTLRAITGEFDLTVSMTSGNIVGVRGVVDMKSFNDAGFLYGTQGKLVTGTGEIAAGSGHVCGAIGQLDLSGATLTSGHIACLIASIQDSSPHSSSVVNGIYIEVPNAGYINAALQTYGNYNFVLDAGSNNGLAVSATGTAGALTAGWLKVKVEGVTKYIPLSASVS